MINTIKRYAMPVGLIILFVYINYGNYTLYGSSIYKRNTPTEVKVSNVKLDYAYVTTTGRRGKTIKYYYMTFYLNQKKQYVGCSGYNKLCEELKPYYVTEMTYLQYDSSHGLIKSMKVQPTDNSSPDPILINNKNNLLTIPNYLTEQYERPIELFRWIFYGSLLLIPLAIFVFLKARKDEEDE